MLRPKNELFAEASNQRRRIVFWGKKLKCRESGKSGESECCRTESVDKKESRLHSVLPFAFFFPLCSSQSVGLFFFFSLGQRVSASFQRARSILLEKDETAPPLDAHSHLYIYTYSIPLLHVCEREKQSQRMANDNGKSLDGPQYGVSLLGT